MFTLYVCKPGKPNVVTTTHETPESVAQALRSVPTHVGKNDAKTYSWVIEVRDQSGKIRSEFNIPA